ncbi:MAG: FRG domain-containing protein [Firmicutes bacterium]|nr:FRG domain-containing protein [Bacillota bacterium]
MSKKPVTSVAEYVKLIASYNTVDIDGTFFYRGQGKHHSDDMNDVNQPQASIFRKCDEMHGVKQLYEKKYYYEAITRFPHEFEGLSSIDRLAKMQHYGWPTRLLDFTRKPLVALYFACEDANEQNDGIVYVVKAQYKKELEDEGCHILSYDSDRALLLGCFSRLTKNEYNRIKDFVEEQMAAFAKNNKGSTQISLSNADREYRINLDTIDAKGDEKLKRAFSKLYSEAERERAAFRVFDTRPQDLWDSFMLSPQSHKMQNERLMLQDGAFCIMGLSGNATSNSRSIILNKIIIDKSKKVDLLKDLNALGVNYATIYGDLSAAAKQVDARVVAKLKEKK